MGVALRAWRIAGRGPVFAFSFAAAGRCQTTEIRRQKTDDRYRRERSGGSYEKVTHIGCYPAFTDLGQSGIRCRTNCPEQARLISPGSSVSVYGLAGIVELYTDLLFRFLQLKRKISGL